VSQSHIAIVFPIESEFSPYISCFYTWQQLMFAVSGFEHKGIKTILLALYNQLGKDNGIITIYSHIPRPELNTVYSRRMQYKLLCFMFINGCGF